MRPMLWMLAVCAITVAGCKGEKQPAERAQAAGQPGMSGMKMDSMPTGGSKRGTAGSSLMPMMRAHMDSMTRISPEQMSTMMAAHGQLMSQLMDRMGADMRAMHMSGDTKWNALVDSVKADLAELPELHGNELATTMKAHRARVERLIDMHEGMMKGM